MVDVSGKAATEREATAEGRVVMRKETLDTLLAGNAIKGDALGAARIVLAMPAIADIQQAKDTLSACAQRLGLAT